MKISVEQTNSVQIQCCSATTDPKWLSGADKKSKRGACNTFGQEGEKSMKIFENVKYFVYFLGWSYDGTRRTNDRHRGLVRVC